MREVSLEVCIVRLQPSTVMGGMREEKIWKGKLLAS